MTSPALNRPLRSLEEVTAGRMVALSLNRGELTTLMHVLEEARDVARKRLTAATVDASRVPSDLRAKQRDAAEATLSRVSDLCERVTDAWREGRP